MDGSAILEFTARSTNGTASVVADVGELVIAGWTGRDAAAMEAHIRELEALGVARPKKTPIFYRVAAALLTTAREIQVPGRDSSGEAEAVLICLDDGLWLGVGSDHTDRRIETVNVTASKQMCAKPVGTELWRFEDVEDHWDALELRSYVTVDGRRRPYQEGRAESMRHPRDLAALYGNGGSGLAPGTAMFCGTIPVIDEFVFGELFEMELYDPVLDRRLSASYAVRSLPVEG